ncbi:hypothetical protein MRB53_039933 [Persea americana]|nr:hypothetical protein MRB53_039933 [Persea americana]
MPLHLLGKKSWNVYNTDNIERVRRDEAEAQAKEEAEEQRLQEEDAANRIALLRGQKVIEKTRQDDQANHDKRDELLAHHTAARPHKRRRLHGEDDTDREIRWAKEDAELGQQVATRVSKREDRDEPLHDEAGHIQLVSSAERDRDSKATDVKVQKTPEIEYASMRFKDAAGYKNDGQAPWYAKQTSHTTVKHETLSTLPEKNVWGNEDPRRKERELGRVASNDPLAFMKQAQRQLKQSEKDREQYKAEQDAEIRQLRRDSRSHRKNVQDRPDINIHQRA